MTASYASGMIGSSVTAAPAQPTAGKAHRAAPHRSPSAEVDL
jgi:hypothetical protein